LKEAIKGGIEGEIAIITGAKVVFNGLGADRGLEV
jgi:hypothetical protein